jgi:predicted deacylase
MSKQSFIVAGVEAAAGERAAKVLDLTLAGVQTKMPLFVLNGAGEGPTVVVTAGIHGSEYVGMAAAMRLAQETDVSQLKGQLVIAPICSMTAYARRAIYIAPPDDKNLNRMFPGNPTGSFAEQLADWIFTNLIQRANYYLDLHGGDLNEALVPFSIIKRTTNAALNERAHALAAAFGIPLILAVEDTIRGGTYSSAADAGIPAVLAEIGGQGLWRIDEVQDMLHGLHRALAHAGALQVSAPPPRSSGLVPRPEERGSGEAPATRVLEEMAWLRSDHDGMFYTLCKVGDEVKAGQLLGYVTDFLGNKVQEAVAPVDGTVLFLVTTLAMNAGDPLLSVGA